MAILRSRYVCNEINIMAKFTGTVQTLHYNNNTTNLMVVFRLMGKLTLSLKHMLDIVYKIKSIHREVIKV